MMQRPEEKKADELNGVQVVGKENGRENPPSSFSAPPPHAFSPYKYCGWSAAAYVDLSGKPYPSPDPTTTQLSPSKPKRRGRLGGTIG